MAMLDTVIIGAGPAGMTAAIYAKRKGLSLSIISNSVGGQMSTSGNIENYPGYDSISGAQLSGKMKGQMNRLGVDVVSDRVSVVEKIPGGYRIRTEGGKTFEARSVIVASGAHWREIGVPGERDYLNKGVSYCSTCDGPLFADLEVAVVGGGNNAADSALELSGIATKVYMIVRSRIKADKLTQDKIRANGRIVVLEGYTVVRITGRDFVESIEIKSACDRVQTINVGGVFVEIGHDPLTAFVKSLVQTNQKGEIVIDEFNRTTAEGIFGCGDVTDVPQKQVVVAAGEGAKAAMSAYTYISNLAR